MYLIVFQLNELIVYKTQIFCFINTDIDIIQAKPIHFQRPIVISVYLTNFVSEKKTSQNRTVIFFRCSCQ